MSDKADPNRSPTDELAGRLAKLMRREGRGEDISGLERLSGGANMESWRFACGGADFVLRRAPSADWLDNRPVSIAQEAGVIRATHAAGVPAPEVIAELADADGLGAGFIMRAISGSADPRHVLSTAAPALIEDIAGSLADILAIDPAAIAGIPELEARQGVEKLAADFERFGGDRPVIALGLAWLRRNLPARVEPRLVHGDFRVGNLMTEHGRLTGVLDWELCHLGDPHEDLAYGCMAVWRFGAIDQPAFGIADLERFFAAYRAAGGREVEPERFRFWLVYRTVWWALGCLDMGAYWRDGSDRSLERVVVARRTSEQELDLLMLLEEEVGDRAATLPVTDQTEGQTAVGEPTEGEVLQAVSEWLGANIKPKLEGRDRFDLAVARNALGIVQRQLAEPLDIRDRALAQDLLAGRQDLTTPGLLARLRKETLAKVQADMPKYPSIPVARAKWETPSA